MGISKIDEVLAYIISSVNKVIKILKEVRRDLLIGLIVGLILLTGTPLWVPIILSHIPLQWKQTEEPEVVFLPGDFEIDLNDPYNRPGITSIEIKVKVKGGDVTLLRDAEILDQQIDTDDFVIAVPNIKLELVRVVPKDALLDTAKSSSIIQTDFDSGALIPRGDFVSRYAKGDITKFGSIKIKLFYEVKNKVLSKEIIIPMYFVKK